MNQFYKFPKQKKSKIFTPHSGNIFHTHQRGTSWAEKQQQQKPEAEPRRPMLSLFLACPHDGRLSTAAQHSWIAAQLPPPTPALSLLLSPPTRSQPRKRLRRQPREPSQPAEKGSMIFFSFASFQPTYGRGVRVAPPPGQVPSRKIFYTVAIRYAGPFPVLSHLFYALCTIPKWSTALIFSSSKNFHFTFLLVVG